ncbi:unnamed protein product [Xylocopa violacea]|uniref:Ionotropic glutamate receptor C-terminal domain-containing protein n=1 Tax=Xylocopa violacea TaxID=135666 RepID=A0ABP1N1A3_XYLVO
MHVLHFLHIGTVFFVRAHCVYGQDNVTTGENENESRIPSTITVTSWNDMPFSGIVLENGKWVGKGYAFYIFDMISSKLNFTYTIIPPEEHILGDENSGILGLLYEKKVDMAVAFLPMLPEMRRYCTFSNALDETKLTAVVKRPQESATGSGLLAPFETTVWLLVLASLLFVGPVIYLFASISSLLKQGTNIVAATDSTRMLFATWWIFILILTSFYTANLTAFLTKPQFTLSINSLEDIVHKGYNWITYKGRMVDFLLSQNDQNDLSLLNTSKRQGKGVFKYYEFSSKRTILESVGRRKLFLAEVHYLQTLIFNDYINKTHHHLEHNSRCTYVIMPGSILVTGRAFGFSYGSTIEKSINKMLLRFIEAGIVQHREKEDLPLAEICPINLRSSERQLRNTDLLLTYKVVLIGYTIATIIFLFEIIYAFISYRVKKNKIRGYNCLLCCAKRKKPTYPAISDNISKKYSNYILMQRNQQRINGKSYSVVVHRDEDRKLIPVKTPSAFLFQYAA